MDSYYDDYFINQVGGHLEHQINTPSRIRRVYVGVPYQRGHGIGSFLGGLFRQVLPLVKQGFRTLGREALKTGANIANDVAINDIPLKEAFKSRIRETGENFKRKAEEKIDSLMIGSGYNYSKIPKMYQSAFGPAVNSISPVKKKSLKKKYSTKKKKKLSKKKVKKNKNKSKKQKSKKKKPKRSVRDIFA